MAEVVVVIAVQLYEVVARCVFNSPTLWGNNIAYMTNGTCSCWARPTRCA